MSTDLINKVLRIGEGRAMKGMQQRVKEINALEEQIERLSDERQRAHMSNAKTTTAQKEPNPTITKVL